MNFKREFKDFDTPEYDTYSEIWKNERKEILDIESKWDLPEQNHNLTEKNSLKAETKESALWAKVAGPNSETKKIVFIQFKVVDGIEKGNEKTEIAT